jgi:heptosyltransferase-3
VSRVLAVRLDNAGDVLLTGPAIRALAVGAEQLDLVVSPTGAAAARLLPAVDDLIVFDPPWSGFEPVAVERPAVEALVERLTKGRYDQAVVFTSFHQSPLPMALLLRLAGIGRIAADCEDYPGSLLDVRHHRGDGHEVEAALELAAAVGALLPVSDDGRLRLREPLPSSGVAEPGRPFVVVHPGASVPSRALGPDRARAVVGALLADGWAVLVTGGPTERELCDRAAPAGAVNLAGRMSFSQLAGLLARAKAVVVGNTGPAHLAAAVGTPVVSLFSPVVPPERWAPYGVPVVLLGDQQAPCRETRARLCPVAGHPCLNDIDPEDVVRAVAKLAPRGGTP